GRASGAPGRALRRRNRQRHHRYADRSPAQARHGQARNRGTSGELQSDRRRIDHGYGSPLAPRTLEVKLNDGGTRFTSGDRLFLNVGPRAAIPPIPGLQASQPLTHVEALELDYLPAHLIVLGSGYIGLEMAQAYRRFGSRVTIIETGPRLMSRED